MDGRSPDMLPVVILAFYYPPENTSGAYRPHRFARYLPQFGFRPLVVCGRPDLPATPDVRRVPAADAPGWLRRQERLAWWIQRAALPFSEEFPWIPHAVAATSALIREHGCVAMISTHPPIATHLAALLVKRQTGIPWIADFRDPFTDNPFRTWRWPLGTDTRAERRIADRADAIVSNTTPAEEFWKRKYPRHEAKISTIWNGFDPAEQYPCYSLSQRSRPEIVHVGNIYGGRSPAPILRSLERLFNGGHLSPESVLLRFVGPMEDDKPSPWADLLHHFEEKGWAVCRKTLVPLAEAREITARADYLMLIDMNGAGGTLQLPAKIFDYLQVHRPVLACSEGESSPAGDILRRSGLDHTVIYANEPQERTDEKIVGFLRGGARESFPKPDFVNQFSAPCLTGQLATLLRRLISKCFSRNSRRAAGSTRFW